MGLVRLARELKQMSRLAGPFEPLRGSSLALIFEKPSTRTRVSFAVAIQQLGGLPLELNPGALQLSRGETVEDTGRILSRYVDGIILRTGAHGTLEDLAAASTVPVVNGLSDSYHPCQTLADLLTLFERFGYVRGLAVAYVGDGSNMAAAWLEAAALLGIGLRIATPAGYAPDPALVAWASERARARGGGVHITTDPAEAVAGADAVYTDVWVSMGQEAEAADRLAAFRPYQVNRLLMEMAGADAIFMHCLPAHRGQEVTADVLDGPRSVVWDQAENRLHTEKALLVSLLAPRAARA
jgi:ornithine carbamoyltransferase